MLRFPESRPDSRFLHRFNVASNNHDSICRSCAKTIGSSSVEADLLYSELEHKCKDGILIDFAEAVRRSGKTSEISK
ncbi:hypothetical protein HNQ77_004696 [Silvibacterium bohemicum]|uniref:Uncharacterized protein n=1 Tax=Silvibacterium bohemicum TaxID=1577686 RepID=A0A841K2A1_9BACT|nr:hypothetical protein [Silvibacterium bohemicum]